jgi:uncharacterized membrane protein YfcA
VVEHLWWLVLAVGVVAFLYSSVGHAGASGYIAVMGLASLSPALVKPTALLLNIIVASIGTVQFLRAGHFRWHLFWPFALLSIPLAFVGGALDLPTVWFKRAVGVVLLLSAANFFWRPGDDAPRGEPPLPVALAAGGMLGLFAGLTGTGGGIFLTPLMLLSRWARTKVVAATSVLFILVNSLAGLAGNLSAAKSIPSLAWPLAGAAVLGGSLGAWLGSRHLPPVAIKRLLAVVLVVAGLHLLRAS